MRLSGTEYFLTDHVVRGRKTVPGVVYIEMARAAAADAGQRVGRMRSVVWSRPITVDHQPRDVRVEVTRAADGARFEIVTSDGVHAQGQILGETAAPQVTLLDLEAIRRRCTITKSGPECYAAFDASGFTSGAAFHAIQELQLNDHEALSRLKLPSHLTPGAAGDELHPSLMDGALETVVGLIGETAGRPWLPFALDELRIAGPLPDSCHAHVARAAHAAEGTFDIRIADDAGRVAIEMLGLTFRPLDSETPLIETLYFTSVWEQQEAPVVSTGRGELPLLVEGGIASLLTLAQSGPSRAIYRCANGSPEQGAVSAFARALREEHPNVRLSTLAVDDPGLFTGALRDEFAADEVEVRYRGGSDGSGAGRKRTGAGTRRRRRC